MERCLLATDLPPSLMETHLDNKKKDFNGSMRQANRGRSCSLSSSGLARCDISSRASSAKTNHFFRLFRQKVQTVDREAAMDIIHRNINALRDALSAAANCVAKFPQGVEGRDCYFTRELMVWLTSWS